MKTNREFKFRVWDPLGKRFLKYACFFSHFDFSQFHCFDEEFDTEEEQVVIQQYTGLKDKQGTDIFEGDVLRIVTNDSPESPEWELAPVIYDSGAYIVSLNGRQHLYDFLIDLEDIKIDAVVVGNILEDEDWLTSLNV